MTEQPTALRLADELDHPGYGYEPKTEAAAELRRLHELNEGLRDQNTELDEKLAELERINAQLLEALETFERSGYSPVRLTREAIAAAKGEA